MRSNGLTKIAVAIFGVLIMAGPASAYSIYAGVTLDVHQDIPDDSLPEGRLPNDFHIEGMICTAEGTPPILGNHLDDLFPNFSYSFTHVNDCWYSFVADWSLNPGDPGIPYCTVVHMGLLFFIEDENTIIDLMGWWTLDGERVGEIIGYVNNGYVPMTGFDVTTTENGQTLRLGNGMIQPIISPIPILPPGPAPIPVEILELDLISLDPTELRADWFEQLRIGGAQDGWNWIPVLDGDGNDVGPDNPVEMPPDSFFDVFFEIEIPGKMRPAVPVFIDPSDILIVRTKRMFTNNAGVTEPNGGLWEWHIHEAQGPEACCFVDGSCENKAPVDCVAMGGFPQGFGSTCDTVQCSVQTDEACCLPDGSCVVMPASECTSSGGTPMGVANCSDVLCGSSDYLFEFSLDIGSDIEISDPQADGDEAADPGDVYWWQSAAIVPPGRDGFKDDFSIFGFDPYPDPPDAALATRVWIGQYDPEYYHNYFDLDGHDQLDVSLNEKYGLGPEPMPVWIDMWDSPCVHMPENLMISFDDDTAPGWPAPIMSVPTMAPSPLGIRSYGSTAGRDEIVGLTINTATYPPTLMSLYPIAAEDQVHASLAPNPDTGDDKFDDDIDSLDIVASEETCPFWYFSPDHEADFGLDPGSIYERVAGGPVQVIDDVINLGLMEETDVDAFEFVWLTDPDGTLHLGVVFSVDEDDPLTGGDESGGLNPSVVYASFLNGTFFVFLEQSVEDDIDAITAWPVPIGEEDRGACCYPDGSCNVELAVTCVANGGTYMGNGTTCSPNPCPQPSQACCYPDGTCADVDATTCRLNGGIPQGAGTTCATVTCPQPTEACCYPDGSCADVDATTCTQNGGTPQGSGTTCATVTCPQPTEACCYPDGTCADVDATTCTQNGGTPQGSGTTCATVTCPQPSQACCYPDGTCQDVDYLTCRQNGGVPQGPGTSCATTICPQPAEACCYPDGSCADVDPNVCLQNGGTPQGSGTTCATVTCPQPLQACCYPDGTCADQDPNVCTANGGTPQGGGTSCAVVACPQPAEACCFPDGTCADLYAVVCTANGGTPQGSGTTCATTTCPQPATEACCYPDGSCADVLPSTCIQTGGVPQGAGTTCSTTICPEPVEYMLEFSVDIGSDTELSDPNRDGDEGFDPGDVYFWQSAPVTPPGRDGFKDDAFIFNGTDPWPDAPDASASTAVPVGNGTIQDYWEWFDLDGHDQIDVDLRQYDLGGDVMLMHPIPWFASSCIYSPQYMQVSLDDDMAPGWPANDVPVTVPSSAGVSSYGSTAGRDEVIGLDLGFAIAPPYPAARIYRIADEVKIHNSLAPNPDGIEEDDDDVDSLDLVRNQDVCPYWYFTADHEAHMTLDYSDIYLVTSAGPVPVIDEVAHLGIPDETDIDAFEFTWLQDFDDPDLKYLGILFSVDEDDPLTAADESGGLNPRAVYGSVLTGYSYVIFEEFEDDIDALSTWHKPLVAPRPPVIVAAASWKLHGSAGSFSIDVTSKKSIEPRSGGPTSIVVNFSEAIQLAGGGPNVDVVVSSGTVTSLSVSGTTLTVGISGTTNAQWLKVSFPGVQTSAGLATSDGLEIGVLLGDANASQTTNVADASYVLANRGTVSATTVQLDINADGFVNVADASYILSNRTSLP